MKAPADIVIVGGGIGGLAVAAALRLEGLEATVLEQAPVLGEVGAGIAVWSNAGRVLRHLGVDLGPVSRPVDLTVAASDSGKVLTQLELAPFFARRGIADPCRIVHRADLHRLLRERLDPARLRTGARCLGVDTAGARPVVRLEGGETLEADLVIGADGIRSAVREAVFPGAVLRYSGALAWRGIAERGHPDLGTLREIQGHGGRFGICPIDPDRTYWFATQLAPEGFEVPPAQRREAVLSRYRDFPFGARDCVEATPPEKILLGPLYDLWPVPPRWVEGRVVLLGDAAHAMTPNLGQGAATAMEDAVVLGRLVARAPDLDAALLAYEARRRPRAETMVARSARFGRIGDWANPVAVLAREIALRLTPRKTAEDLFAEQAGYDAVADADGALAALA